MTFRDPHHDTSVARRQARYVMSNYVSTNNIGPIREMINIQGMAMKPG